MFRMTAFDMYPPVEPSVVVAVESIVASSPDGENGPACATAQVLCSNVKVPSVVFDCPLLAKKHVDWFDAPAAFDKFEFKP